MKAALLLKVTGTRLFVANGRDEVLFVRQVELPFFPKVGDRIREEQAISYVVSDAVYCLKHEKAFIDLEPIDFTTIRIQGFKTVRGFADYISSSGWKVVGSLP